MTNAQKWIAAFLGLFLLLFVLGRVTKKEDDYAPLPENYSENSAAQSQEVDGLALIKRNNCTTCHGGELQGTKMGPALANLKENWSRDNLINYLRNPSAYSGDSRFKEYKITFKNIMMPSYGNLDVKDLGKMADYLLSK
ncbi:MAG: cytochrome c [Ignavibacteria bacterium]|jgi:mono/diheme cytochrome c family protein|nr:cytochrome c [Ignavibacteria bacterium]